MKSIQTIYRNTCNIKVMHKALLKNIIAFFTMLILVSTITAQDYNDLRRVEFGARYMPTFSAIDLKAFNDDVIQGSVSVNHGFGIMLGVNLTKNFGIQGEVNYYQVSQSFRDLNLDNEVNIKYLNIPLLLSINTNKERRVNFNVVAGPQFGINAGSNITTTGTGEPDDVKAII